MDERRALKQASRNWNRSPTCATPHPPSQTSLELIPPPLPPPSPPLPQRKQTKRRGPPFMQGANQRTLILEGGRLRLRKPNQFLSGVRMGGEMGGKVGSSSTPRAACGRSWRSWLRVRTGSRRRSLRGLRTAAQKRRPRTRRARSQSLRTGRPGSPEPSAPARPPRSWVRPAPPPGPAKPDREAEAAAGEASLRKRTPRTRRRVTRRRKGVQASGPEPKPARPGGSRPRVPSQPAGRRLVAAGGCPPSAANGFHRQRG